MLNARHAAATAELARLFDLRPTSPTSERSARAWTPGDLDDRRLVGHPEADPVFVEQYRRVAAALHHARVEHGFRSVLVASAVAAEGKTLSATNLALVLSRFERRVLLVDGDLRKPAIHRLLGIENGAGLSDILKQPGACFSARTLTPTLSVITGGQPDPDPVALLVSDAAGQFMAHAGEHFDWVVVDTPPIMLFPDAGVFADRLDTCVMVVSAATTASPVAARAVEAVGASRILGVVLNRAEPSEIAAGYDYGQYKTPLSGRARGRFASWRSRGM